MEAGECATIQELAEAVGLAERHGSRQLRLAYFCAGGIEAADLRARGHGSQSLRPVFSGGGDLEPPTAYDFLSYQVMHCRLVRYVSATALVVSSKCPAALTAST